MTHLGGNPASLLDCDYADLQRATFRFASGISKTPSVDGLARGFRNGPTLSGLAADVAARDVVEFGSSDTKATHHEGPAN
jgi:hypothetical protein